MENQSMEIWLGFWRILTHVDGKSGFAQRSMEDLDEFSRKMDEHADVSGKQNGM